MLAAAFAAPVQGRTTPAAPAPIPTGRSLAALTVYEHALLALRPGRTAERLVLEAGGRPVSRSQRLWQVDGRAALRLVPLLSRRGLLRYAEPDYPRHRTGHLDEGDPLLDLAWHIARIGADQVEPPGPGVPVTLVDTGIDLDHPEFASRPDIVELTEQSTPKFGEPEYHGTIVASIAGAPSDGVGTVGIYPRSVLRSYDLPDLEDSTIIVGIDRAAAAGPSVINLSIGGPGYSRSLYEAVMRAVNAGSLVVAAAGNDFYAGNPEIYPADYPHVLTVGATNTSNQPASFSSSSPAVDLAAPGVDLPVQNPTNSLLFGLYSGTSFAAPIVSAAAAWIWTARPELDATQVSAVLRSGARDVGKRGFDNRTGFGLLNIPRALAAAPPPSDPLEPNDDVDLVTARGIFGAAKPRLTGPGNASSSLRAGIDAAEDPADIYRVHVPAGGTLEVMVTPQADVGVTLWDPRTESVHGRRARSGTGRLASSDRAGHVSERLTWRNARRQGVTAYLEVWLPRRLSAAPRTGYALRIRVR
jgi:hypothetical protein